MEVVKRKDAYIQCKGLARTSILCLALSAGSQAQTLAPTRQDSAIAPEVVNCERKIAAIFNLAAWDQLDATGRMLGDPPSARHAALFPFRCGLFKYYATAAAA
jgi:hypothetical protein